MNKLIAFAGLDFKLLRAYKISILVLLIWGVGMGFTMNSVNSVPSYMMVALMLCMSYPFAVGEKNGLETLYATLSLNRKTVVIGRYLFVFTMEVITMAFAVLSTWAAAMVLNEEFVLTESLLILFVSSGIFSMIVAIQYPIYFKMGYNKAKFVALIPLVMILIIVLQIQKLLEFMKWDISLNDLLTKAMENQVLTYAVMVLGGLLILSLSCFVSYKFYCKKDV